MARRIFPALLIYFSAALILLSAAGIALIWINRAPLIRESVRRVEAVDAELVLAQSAIRDARGELDRTLRIVDTAEDALNSLKDQTEEAKGLFEQFNRTLDGSILPGLQTTKGGIARVRAAIEGLQETLDQINAFPLLNLDLPGDEFLSSLISGVDSLNAQINAMQELVRKAEVFTSDTAYLLGGDLSETRQNIETLRVSLVEYDRKVTSLHVEARGVIRSLPVWINRASIGLTLFLLWFGFSQFGLLLHGLNLREGRDPLAALRKPPPPEAFGE